MDDEMGNASAMMGATMDGFKAPEMPSLGMPKEANDIMKSIPKTPDATDMGMTLKTPELS